MLGAPSQSPLGSHYSLRCGRSPNKKEILRITPQMSRHGCIGETVIWLQGRRLVHNAVENCHLHQLLNQRCLTDRFIEIAHLVVICILANHHGGVLIFGIRWSPKDGLHQGALMLEHQRLQMVNKGR